MGLSSIFATITITIIISLSYLINSSIDSLEEGLEHCLLDHLVGRLDHLCNFGFLDISYQILWA